MKQAPPLRRGWTTGTCATAAVKAATAALFGGTFPDPVQVTLPGGQIVSFALAEAVWADQATTAGVVKDAGDDPDVTHGALIRATVWRGPAGSGVTFRAGPGVGMVTRPGLPIPPGEPAINPVPRRMIRDAVAETAATFGTAGDVVAEIAIPDGEALAQRTLNPRLGILGGLSILGTTGIVVPYSCAAWIDSIHRGVDVARAMGLTQIACATGSTSEAAVQALHGLPDTALIEMGDFVGGVLKYLRTHPVQRVTICGGVAKMTKLAQGRLDLHSKRGSADMAALAALVRQHAAPQPLADMIEKANTVLEVFEIAYEIPLGDMIAAAAWQVAAEVLRPTTAELEIVVFDRAGRCVGRKPFAPIEPGHAAPPSRKRRL